MADQHTPDETRFDEATGQYTTGHSWDGIEELNTPMPRWWLGIFYLSIVFAIIYSFLMPAIPLLNGYTKGFLGRSDRVAVADELSALKASRAELSGQLVNANLETIQSSPELFRFAMAAGKSAFGDNCATCHGAGGQGFKGYPNLNDDVWLWGGTFEDIRHTLEVGIRSAHEDSRLSLMSAYGRDGFLSSDDINDVVDYVLSFQGETASHDTHKTVDSHVSSPASKARGKAHFEENCTSCHGTDLTGDRTQGAPNLKDNDWLYGGTREEIYETIWDGRQGVMPNWNERLDPSTVTALAVYVHGLGGGEATPELDPILVDPILVDPIPAQDTETP